MPAYDECRVPASAAAASPRASPGPSAPSPYPASTSTIFSAPYSGSVPAEENTKKTQKKSNSGSVPADDQKINSGSVPADDQKIQKTQKNDNSGSVPADDTKNQKTQKNATSAAPARVSVSASFRAVPLEALSSLLVQSSLPRDSLLRALLAQRLQHRAANPSPSPNANTKKRCWGGDDSERFGARCGPNNAHLFALCSGPVVPGFGTCSAPAAPVSAPAAPVSAPAAPVSAPTPARVAGKKRRGEWDDNARFSGRRGRKSGFSGVFGPSQMVGAIWRSVFWAIGPTLPVLPGVVLAPGPVLMALGPLHKFAGRMSPYRRLIRPLVGLMGAGAQPTNKANKKGIWGKLMRRPGDTAGASKPHNKIKSTSSCFRPRPTKNVATTFAKGAVKLLSGCSVVGWRNNHALANNALCLGIALLLCGANVCSGVSAPFCRPHESSVLGKRSREATIRQELPERMFRRARAVPGNVGASGVAPATSPRGHHAGGRRFEGHRRRWAQSMPNFVVTFGPMVSVPGGRTVLLGFPPYHIVPGRFVSIAPGVVWYLRPRHSNAVASNVAMGAEMTIAGTSGASLAGASAVGADHVTSVGAGHAGSLLGAAGVAAPSQGLSRRRAGGRRGRGQSQCPTSRRTLAPCLAGLGAQPDSWPPATSSRDTLRFGIMRDMHKLLLCYIVRKRSVAS
ncbi:hypothetical protein DM01DRAFT_1369647 [Hesseltinella vesiculosa]|uniref:Uncharacterized protein n=1 Tax=Hesseltinella vesiculosa TaxID=101127 RepID=A0A1X2GZL0_9FUNG|nr:hypothetical protein DM01DRAFT_1369647 [Hesseltinella vesiculosa]